MAASATQNPSTKSDSKSSKKKSKSKTESKDAPAAPTPAPVAAVSTPAESTNGDASYESPYIKELYKSIRNVNKKIANASKVDNVLAENPGKSLDELVASRKINADQKAQILKKPALQASLTQLEEQIAQYKKFDQEHKLKLQTEKAEVEKSLTERSAKELEEAVAAAKAEGQANVTKSLAEGLLVLTQFLKLAAIRRGEDEASMELDENKALEGILAKLYNGDEVGVEYMLKLINGVDETTVSVADEPLETTYASLKTISVAHYEAVKQASVPEPVATESQEAIVSDPTLVNAGLTEIDDPTIASMTNGHEEAEPTTPTQGIPQNSGFGDGANAAAEANWDQNNDLSTSQEWVEVPRDAAETDTGVTATPAAPSNVQSWADDQPDSPVEATPPPANPNDGFHEVQRSRGGQGRGRGGRGGDGYRGRGGFRGDRGRGGRGGPRGGAPRGRPQES